MIRLMDYSVEELNKNEYGTKLVNAKKMWEKGITGKGIRIAILDSGCDYNNPILKNNIIGGQSFVDDDYMDSNGHGTHVAGTIVAMAKDVELLIVKVLDGRGSGSFQELLMELTML